MATKRRPVARKPKTKPERHEFEPTSKLVSTCGADSWHPPWGRLFAKKTYLTEFLGRLWSLFGAPNGDDGKGFVYTLRETTTGTILTAYAGASGPSFGNVTGKRDVVVDALEALVNATKPVDCRCEVDYGASTIGIAKGKHFYDYRGPTGEAGDEFTD
jgi:hypothetical protein